jgi:hypothetical protein
MNVYTVEAQYSVIRRVSMEVIAPDEIGAQSKIERLIAGECDVAKGWLEGAVDADVKVLHNGGKMVPQHIGVAEASGT